MDWPYIHTLVNHFPIILTVVGCAVLLLAFITKKRGVWLYAVSTLTLAGLSVYPADFTGDQASDALRGTWYVVRTMVAEHDESASYALVVLLLLGAASAIAWWYMLRRDTAGLPPQWLRITLAVLAILGISVVTRTAYLGGKIIHESPMLKNPPAGMTLPSPGSQ
jgi:hypothetical protein